MINKTKKIFLNILLLTIFTSFFLNIMVINLDGNTAAEEKCFNDLNDICNYVLKGFINKTHVNQQEKQFYEQAVFYEDELKNIDLFVDNFGCLAHGTKVLMADRSIKNIEYIKPGDKVLSFDTADKKPVVSTVVYTKDVYRQGVYTINDNVLSFTDDHPLFVKTEKGEEKWSSINPLKSYVHYSYRKSDRLNIGDKFYNLDEGWIEIKSIRYNSSYQKLISLQVDSSLHNFIANNVVVSNAYYNLSGYIEGVESLNIERYNILSENKILALGELKMDELRNVLDIPIGYSFMITIEYQVEGQYRRVPIGDTSAMYSDFLAIQTQNVLIILRGGSYSFGKITVEVVY